eukprot:7389814-Prymnesium_polylepis.1
MSDAMVVVEEVMLTLLALTMQGGDAGRGETSAVDRQRVADSAPQKASSSCARRLVCIPICASSAPRVEVMWPTGSCWPTETLSWEPSSHPRANCHLLLILVIATLLVIDEAPCSSRPVCGAETPPPNGAVPGRVGVGRRVGAARVHQRLWQQLPYRGAAAHAAAGPEQPAARRERPVRRA